MEPVVNSVLGVLILMYDLVRGLLDWGGGAILTGLLTGAGAYLGVRAAHQHDTSKPMKSVSQ